MTGIVRVSSHRRAAGSDAADLRPRTAADRLAEKADARELHPGYNLDEVMATVQAAIEQVSA